MEHAANATTPTAIPALTPQQWQGLAQLGDMVSGLATSLNGDFGSAVAGGVRRAGDLYERYELPELLNDVLAALKAMRDSGLLRLIRDNVELAVQTIQLLEPLVSETVAALQKVPVERWKRHVVTVDRLLMQAHALSQFVDKNLAGELTEAIVKLTALDQETDAGATLTDALRLIAKFRANGTFKRLADLSDHLTAFADSTDTSTLIGNFVKGNDGGASLGSVGSTLRTWTRIAEAVQAAQQHQGSEVVGGIRGLIKLLKDPAVQHGIRLVTRVSGYVEAQNRGAPAAS